MWLTKLYAYIFLLDLGMEPIFELLETFRKILFTMDSMSIKTKMYDDVAVSFHRVPRWPVEIK